VGLRRSRKARGARIIYFFHRAEIPRRYRIRRRRTALGDRVGLAWCSVCGGNHQSPKECPGELRATGPERHGWRVTVDTPYGFEAYGVLVAPSVELWRARIITYPNVLWMVRGRGF
jgi:hypothetical protein